jgi:hypothetical protein
MPRGFMPGYTRWTNHGEAEIVQEGQYIGREYDDLCTDLPADEYTDMSMVEDSKTPLFLGCEKEHTKLRIVLSLLQLKASNRLSDTSFTELLLFLQKLLPKGNVLPENTYQAMQVVCPLGLYRREHADLEVMISMVKERIKDLPLR